MFKKSVIFLVISVIICSLLSPVYAAEENERSVPMLSSNVCPNCSVRMSFEGRTPYEVSFQKLNKQCPNSDVETGSHEHRYYYNDDIYVCSLCNYQGILRAFVKERCAISGFYRMTKER